MDRVAIEKLQSECSRNLTSYVSEAEVLCELLKESLDEPITSGQHAALQAQRMRESDASSLFDNSRKRLFEAVETDWVAKSG